MLSKIEPCAVFAPLTNPDQGEFFFELVRWEGEVFVSRSFLVGRCPLVRSNDVVFFA